MNAGMSVDNAVGRVAWSDDISSSVTRIKRPTWRQRLGRWVAGEPDPVIFHMKSGMEMMSEGAAKEKSAAMNEIDGGFRFRIIPASNGKIIGYFPIPRDGDDTGLVARIQGRQIGESLYVLKEGEDLLSALAVCLVLDRIKQA